MCVLMGQKSITDMVPAITTDGTTIPRHISAIIDNVVAMLLSVVAAKQLPDDQPAQQIVLLVATYLAYYLVFEIALTSTPGKLMNGLVVRGFDGSRCSVRQICIRTLTRLVEVNPVLLGGLPAATSILWSRNKQRFGDKLAHTVVIRRSDL